MAISRRKPGRPSKGDGALSCQIMARATDAQRNAYLAAGGADWLRAQLDIEIRRQRERPAPTAHQPFPGVSVTDARGNPIPHTVITREF